MNFQAALTAMQAGHRVRRAGWRAGRYLTFCEGDLLVCTVVEPAHAAYTAYASRRDDILATDWELVPA